MFRLGASSCRRSGRTFNPKVAGSIPARPIRNCLHTGFLALPTVSGQPTRVNNGDHYASGNAVEANLVDLDQPRLGRDAIDQRMVVEGKPEGLEAFDDLGAVLVDQRVPADDAARAGVDLRQGVAGVARPDVTAGIEVFAVRQPGVRQSFWNALDDRVRPGIDAIHHAARSVRLTLGLGPE